MNHKSKNSYDYANSTEKTTTTRVWGTLTLLPPPPPIPLFFIAEHDITKFMVKSTYFLEKLVNLVELMLLEKLILMNHKSKI